ncbi:MAG: hypothetical protein COU29_00940 [Candidatus Magasanikbacteria bacterium CG10_big_fil_rev_8_21_14_0_10_36_32]|uniref:Amino acid transporter transmembrane domain-containing protein n=1 Tax=Candidatus Magasanikbacteria bacterium CG10_big_fil_rev_8_21_14_0_10_36_32 TaxID=1974646 RepID=A0A2M6W6C2_9BACT|nr:MAG: hypothetical protein COU29_00940 [Candidatus Magasanikbacteria bacterium CG10_big_fil_rev_8_21_14_0_10_36_32]
MLKNEKSVVLHQGVYKQTATVSEAVFMITGMTIGAGILGLPYVVAQVGLIIGLIYILVLGLVVMMLNLIIGEIAVRTKENFQIPGFAGRYLGCWAKRLMSLIIILTGYGALLAYIIGEGEALSAMFGGDKVWWSICFWSIGSILIWRGLQTVKNVEKILSMVVIGLIVGLSLFLLDKFHPANFFYTDLTKLFLPYGVILFALNATPAIAEAHALLPGSQKHFRKAIIIGGLIPIGVYLLFVLAVVGFLGVNTTEIATVGLNHQFGGWVYACANLFAALAMGTGFLGIGIALKQSLIWDHKINRYLAEFAVISVPVILFLFGFRSFVSILDVIGGLFIGIEAVLLVAIAYKARKKGDLDASRYGLNNFWLVAIPVLLFFSAASIYTVVKLFH